jgi:hypothetical protein
MSSAMSRAAPACSLLAGVLVVVCPDAALAHDIPDLDNTVFVTRLGGYTPDAAVRAAAIETITRGYVLQLQSRKF